MAKKKMPITEITLMYFTPETPEILWNNHLQNTPYKGLPP